MVHINNFSIPIMADVKLISDFRIHTHCKNKTIGNIEGNFEFSNIEEIKKEAEIALNKNQKEEKKRHWNYSKRKTINYT